MMAFGLSLPLPDGGLSMGEWHALDAIALRKHQADERQSGLIQAMLTPARKPRA